MFVCRRAVRLRELMIMVRSAMAVTMATFGDERLSHIHRHEDVTRHDTSTITVSSLYGFGVCTVL